MDGSALPSFQCLNCEKKVFVMVISQSGRKRMEGLFLCLFLFLSVVLLCSVVSASVWEDMTLWSLGGVDSHPFIHPSIIHSDARTPPLRSKRSRVRGQRREEDTDTKIFLSSLPLFLLKKEFSAERVPFFFFEETNLFC